MPHYIKGRYIYWQKKKKTTCFKHPSFVGATLRGLIPSRHAQHAFIATESSSCLHLKSCQRQKKPKKTHTHPYLAVSTPAASGIMFDTAVICQIHLL